ncbi:unnamed protein product [Amaranthus hypochondriacus]
MSLIDIVLIARSKYDGDGVMYQDLAYRCSQLFVWTTILLLSRCDIWYTLWGNHLLCIWWIVKSLFQIPHLQLVLSSYEVWWCFKESLTFLLDVVFAICINIFRMRTTFCNRMDNQLENPLLFHDLEEGNLGNSETLRTIWTLLTFNSIKSIMDKGATKQLDFEDLLDLPLDMDPSSCHALMLTSWRAQQSENRSNPSFFKAICFAYGWSYFRLGLLKVFNDCMGFAGPLLLNKLIQFLQKGSGGMDGFLFAVSLGLTSVLK